MKVVLNNAIKLLTMFVPVDIQVKYIYFSQTFEYLFYLVINIIRTHRKGLKQCFKRTFNGHFYLRSIKIAM